MEYKLSRILYNNFSSQNIQQIFFVTFIKYTSKLKITSLTITMNNEKRLGNITCESSVLKRPGLSLTKKNKFRYILPAETKALYYILPLF